MDAPQTTEEQALANFLQKMTPPVAEHHSDPSRTAAYDKIRTEIENLVLDRGQVQLHGKGINSLVFEGGGMRGIAFGGCIRFLEEYELIKNIRRIAGSSAGAIVATALAIGYTAQEIIDVLQNTDFETFKDDSWGVVFDLIRLMTQFGIYKGDAFFKWFSDLVEKKTGNPNTTFADVYDKFGITLVITGTCLNRAETYYFHHRDPRFAKMPIALGVRISMSIPLFWKAVWLGEDVMVDGGLLNNYPIYVFDGKTIGDSDVSDEAIEKSTTIGMKLMTSEERADHRLYHINDKISGPVEYIKAFLNAILIQVERNHIRDGYWERTVCINTHEVSSLDFSLNHEQKTALVHEGYVAAKNFFHCRMQGTQNHMNHVI